MHKLRLPKIACAFSLECSYSFSFTPSYGNTICISETVDSKVVPVWTDEKTLDAADLSHGDSLRRKKSRATGVVIRQHSVIDEGVSDFTDLAEMVNPLARWGRVKQNDLQIQVDPFETSKSLRLSIIGERLQSNVELGVLQIPLGPALECCAQSLEDFDEDRDKATPSGLPPAYV